MANNLFSHPALVSSTEKKQQKKQNAVVLWFTGLSGSGKSTLASHLSKKLYQNGNFTYILDGDNIRLGINSDLDFTDAGRKENIRRVAEIAKLFIDCGEIVLTAFVSPFYQDRELAKAIIGESHFVEVFVDTPLEECEKRDTKGLYAKARIGEIKHFTGIDSPYEIPSQAQIVIKTKDKSIASCVDDIYEQIKEKIKLP